MVATANLYEKLGGEETIAKVVRAFYEKVLADDTVNGFFAHTDMDKQMRHQTAFIGFALGSGRQYQGKSMAKAHEGMNLQPVHYDAIVRHLGDTLREFGVSPEDIRQVADKLNTLRDDILYK
ncbi:group I truncated hemoglobin [Paenibacillus flagellatus]|uniref:Group 1 truncated hemoglobin n=1 Tax=Paenibacillus flagellatus TaxID=2211139 RepID=A0A2V5KBH3_9BACL|nr:group 1 truncated hemoglobin [Paenibacillus flagellatus]PYI56895.1 group 1 truncated hemoglobin [Paenibacillus flagellatus]